MRYYLNYFILIFLTLTIACKQKGEKTAVKNNDQQIAEEFNRPLEVSLNKKKDAFEKKASEEIKVLYASGIDSIIQTDIVKNAINIGDTAPDFALTDALGKEVSLQELLKNGPVILMWYRGGWCPYCNLTLVSMQEHLTEFKSLGAQLVALSPELPDNSISTKEKKKLDFEVLSDINNKVAKQFGIVYKLTDEIAARYQKSFDLIAYNGNDRFELPLAATYIIDVDQKVKFAFLNADYKKRAEPRDIIATLELMRDKQY